MKNELISKATIQEMIEERKNWLNQKYDETEEKVKVNFIEMDFNEFIEEQKNLACYSFASFVLNEILENI